MHVLAGIACLSAVTLFLFVYARLHALERRIAKLENGRAASLNPTLGTPEPKGPASEPRRG